MLSRFHQIPERYRRPDGRTDRIAILISHVSVLMRDKKWLLFVKVIASQTWDIFLRHTVL